MQSSIWFHIYTVRDIKKIYGTFAIARSHTHDHMLDGERANFFLEREFFKHVHDRQYFNRT